MNVGINNGGSPAPNIPLLAKRAHSGRYTLLALAVITAMNIVLIGTNSDNYFLFSAAIPSILMIVSMNWCGMLPEEFYEGGYDSYFFLDKSVFVVALLVSILIACLYLLCFVLQKDRKSAWLIVGLVLFSIDTAALIPYYGISTALLPDLIFHVIAIVMLARGIHATRALARIPDEVLTAQHTAPVDENGEPVDSPRLRPADMSVKARILVQGEANGYKIELRRVKKTNELVINGNVYDEYVAVIEYPHTLRAFLDGHVICAGMDAGKSCAFIEVDGVRIAKKLRLF